MDDNVPYIPINVSSLLAALETIIEHVKKNPGRGGQVLLGEGDDVTLLIWRKAGEKHFSYRHNANGILNTGVIDDEKTLEELLEMAREIGGEGDKFKESA